MAPVETVRAAPAPTAAPAQVVRQRRPVAKAPAQAPSRGGERHGSPATANS